MGGALSARHRALRDAAFCCALKGASQLGGSVLVVNWPSSSSQNRRASGAPAKRAAGARSSPMTVTRASWSAAA